MQPIKYTSFGGYKKNLPTTVNKEGYNLSHTPFYSDRIYLLFTHDFLILKLYRTSDIENWKLINLNLNLVLEMGVSKLHPQLLRIY